jgi:hypothetical protein
MIMEGSDEDWIISTIAMGLETKPIPLKQRY